MAARELAENEARAEARAAAEGGRAAAEAAHLVELARMPLRGGPGLANPNPNPNPNPTPTPTPTRRACFAKGQHKAALGAALF